jgi:hypothetical protein
MREYWVTTIHITEDNEGPVAMKLCASSTFVKRMGDTLWLLGRLSEQIVARRCTSL